MTAETERESAPEDHSASTSDQHPTTRSKSTTVALPGSALNDFLSIANTVIDRSGYIAIRWSIHGRYPGIELVERGDLADQGGAA